jgi:hypothetical protein
MVRRSFVLFPYRVQTFHKVKPQWGFSDIAITA